VQERRFPGAGGPHHGDELARINGEGDAIERHDIACREEVDLADRLEPEEGLIAHRRGLLTTITVASPEAAAAGGVQESTPGSADLQQTRGEGFPRRSVEETTTSTFPRIPGTKPLTAERDNS